MTKELNNIDNLTNELNSLKIRETKFVISTIAYVPEREFYSNSSDEENDGTFDKKYFTKEFPYTTTRPKGARKKKKVFEDVQIRDDPKLISKVMSPFLGKLSEKSFETQERNKITTSLSVSIALNRMRSLSSSKNKSLLKELKSYVESDIKFAFFGFFWYRHWYKCGENAEVDYEDVRKYYKQLKKINPERAKEFRESEEKNVEIPYQKLRQYAKNHSETKQLIKNANPKDNNIYLSLIDIDTIDFNEIYSAYLRIINECGYAPTVMSTGYEYPEDREYGKTYQLASHLDRMIRVRTAKHIPLGVYYPEPNMCLLIQEDCETLKKSFIDQTRGNKLESACLLKQMQKRENDNFIFSDENPIIIEIPERARLIKKYKTPIPFSNEFIRGASPTEKDVRLFKQVAQSHFHEKVWYDGLFINGAIKLRGTIKYELQKCKVFIAMIHNPKNIAYVNKEYVDIIVNAFKKEAIQNLKKSMESKDIDNIVKASKEVNQYITEFKQILFSNNNEDSLRILKRLRNQPVIPDLVAEE